MRFGIACPCLFGLVTIISLFTHRRVPAVLAFLVAFGAVSLWWQTIKPIAQVDWAPDVARQVTGSLNGDMLTLENVRSFQWCAETAFDEHWERRTYDLAKVQ